MLHIAVETSNSRKEVSHQNRVCSRCLPGILREVLITMISLLGEGFPVCFYYGMVPNKSVGAILTSGWRIAKCAPHQKPKLENA